MRAQGRHQMRRHQLGAAAAFLIAVGGLGLSSTLLERRAAAQAKGAVQAPRFEVDPLWPKPLPNHWILGQTIGVSVDAQDHVWIIHRAGSLEPGEVHATTNPPTAQCCAPAPPILEFDPAGNLVGHWGGPGQGLRLAGLEPRHHGRLQRQRLDRRQRPRRAGGRPGRDAGSRPPGRTASRTRARPAARSRSTTTWS